MDKSKLRPRDPCHLNLPLLFHILAEFSSCTSSMQLQQSLTLCWKGTSSSSFKTKTSCWICSARSSGKCFCLENLWVSCTLQKWVIESSSRVIWGAVSSKARSKQNESMGKWNWTSMCSKLCPSLPPKLYVPKLHLLQLQNSRNRASAALSFLSPSIRLIVCVTQASKTSFKNQAWAFNCFSTLFGLIAPVKKLAQRAEDHAQVRLLQQLREVALPGCLPWQQHWITNLYIYIYVSNVSRSQCQWPLDTSSLLKSIGLYVHSMSLSKFTF